MAIDLKKWLVPPLETKPTSSYYLDMKRDLDVIYFNGKSIEEHMKEKGMDTSLRSDGDIDIIVKEQLLGKIADEQREEAYEKLKFDLSQSGSGMYAQTIVTYAVNTGFISNGVNPTSKCIGQQRWSVSDDGALSVDSVCKVVPLEYEGGFNYAPAEATVIIRTTGLGLVNDTNERRCESVVQCNNEDISGFIEKYSSGKEKAVSLEFKLVDPSTGTQGLLNESNGFEEKRHRLVVFTASNLKSNRMAGENKKKKKVNLSVEQSHEATIPEKNPRGDHQKKQGLLNIDIDRYRDRDRDRRIEEIISLVSQIGEHAVNCEIGNEDGNSDLARTHLLHAEEKFYKLQLAFDEVEIIGHTRAISKIMNRAKKALKRAESSFEIADIRMKIAELDDYSIDKLHQEISEKINNYTSTEEKKSLKQGIENSSLNIKAGPKKKASELMKECLSNNQNKRKELTDLYAMLIDNQGETLSKYDYENKRGIKYFFENLIHKIHKACFGSKGKRLICSTTDLYKQALKNIKGNSSSPESTKNFAAAPTLETSSANSELVNSSHQIKKSTDGTDDVSVTLSELSEPISYNPIFSGYLNPTSVPNFYEDDDDDSSNQFSPQNNKESGESEKIEDNSSFSKN